MEEARDPGALRQRGHDVPLAQVHQGAREQHVEVSARAHQRGKMAAQVGAADAAAKAPRDARVCPGGQLAAERAHAERGLEVGQHLARGGAEHQERAHCDPLAPERGETVSDPAVLAVDPGVGSAPAVAFEVRRIHAQLFAFFPARGRARKKRSRSWRP